MVNNAGANIDLAKAMEFGLIHDLGELFGGDIAMPYAKANKKARTAAKAFEAENHKYLSKFFDKDAKHFRALSAEILNAKSDEALISKIADYIECTHYKLYLHRLSKGDIAMIQKKIEAFTKKMKDKIAKEKLIEFAALWAKELVSTDIAEIFEEVKNK
jgi:5'-deoxynucleotidase YfbR-like HD superfamily hydrolase